MARTTKGTGMRRNDCIVHLTNGEIELGSVMYVVLWRGKSLSGREHLIRGDEITAIEFSPNDPDDG